MTSSTTHFSDLAGGGPQSPGSSGAQVYWHESPGDKNSRLQPKISGPAEKRRIAVVDGRRTGFCRIGTTHKNKSSVDLGVSVVNALCDAYELKHDPDGLCVFGTVIHSANVSNIAREITLESKLHPQTRAFSTIMACATSLAAVQEAAASIERGLVPWAIAGGTESMSNFPVHFHADLASALRDVQFARSTGQKMAALARLRPTHLLPQIPAVTERLTGKSMGEHCEEMVQQWKIPQADQDKWALKSHQGAASGEAIHRRFIIEGQSDNLIRPDTSIEKLSKLKPVFHKSGTITAGNASPLTDGAAAVLLADETYARQKGWTILAFLDDFECAAVDIKTEGLLMAPPYAILRLLNRHQMTLDQFDLIDIHEAFAGQVLCNLAALRSESWGPKKVGLHPTSVPSEDRMNIFGGSISLGHPFAATGARMVMQQAAALKLKQAKRGLLSICAAGGLGLVATLTAADYCK